MGDDAVRAVLLSYGVTKDAADDAARVVPDSALGVLLYGSRARGDHHEASDVDLLILAERPAGTKQLGIVSASTYTPDQLASATGTLFGMHLARDGRILTDLTGRFAELLEGMGRPDPDALFARIRHLGAVLDDEPGQHLLGRTRMARYLLRTAVYVQALAAGEPCFSVRELAERTGDPDLVVRLSADPVIAPEPTQETLDDLVTRLVDVVGDLARNPYESLENLAVTEWEDDEDRATLATLALTGDGPRFDYAALRKVLL